MTPVGWASQDPGQIQTDKELYRVAIFGEFIAGEVEGLTPTLLREIGQSSGLRFEFATLKRREAFAGLDDGSIDLMAMVRTPQREHDYALSKPHHNKPQVIFHHRRVSGIVGLESLPGHAVGVLEGDLLPAGLPSRTELALRTFPSTLRGLLALDRGEIDVFVGAHRGGVHLILKYGLTDIEMSSAELPAQDVCFAAHKRNQRLITLLDGHLDVLRDAGRLAELSLQRAPGRLEQPDWMQRHQALVVSTGLILVVLMIVLLAWNMSMRRIMRSRDIAQTALRTSEMRFRSIFDSSVIGIALNGEDGSFIETNATFQKMFRYSAKDLEGMTFSELLHPDDIDRGRELFRELIERRRDSVHLEKRYSRKDRTLMWGSVNVAAICNEDGSLRYTVAMVEDIMARKRAESALTRSEERLALALEATSEGVWDWNVASGEMFFSLRWCEALGFDPSEVEPDGRFWERLVHPEDLARFYEALNAHFEQKTELFECEVRLRGKSGEYRWNLDRGKVVVRDEDGKPLRMVGVDIDITERKQADTALRAHRNTLQVLARKLLSAREDERRRLARELHDDLSQRLAAIGIDSLSLERDVRGVSERCGDQVAALNSQIRTISADIHQISHRLHPSILDELGLVKAIKGECDAFTRRTGISISFIPPGDYASVEKSIELAVYRIMQECLQNIAKHSQAVSACVGLAVDDENMCLSVRDTGIGFDLKSKRHEHGLGMASIRERAEMLGGSVSFASEIGKGMAVNVTIPRSSEASGRA